MRCDLQSLDVLRRYLAEDHDWISTIDGFEHEFGSTDVFAVDVPGRICILGDHSDYVPYLNANIVTFASSEQRMRALISPRDDRVVRVRSSFDDCEDTNFTIDDDVIERSSNWLQVLDGREQPVPHWSNYVRGAVSYSMHLHGIDFGFDLYIHSTIPPASGTSSSSALTLCGMVAAHLSNGLSWDEKRLTHMGGEAEWYVGTRGGMMDHATMMYAQNNSMLMLEFEGLDFSAGNLEVGPNGCNWYTVFTHPADKSGPMRCAFNELAYVQQSTINGLLKKIGFEHRSGAHGPHFTIDDEVVDWRGVAELLPEFVETEDFGRVRVRDRFRYVIREYLRARSFVGAVVDGDGVAISRLLDASWADTRDLLGTHTDEMELVAAELRKKDGVLGVKVLGAGFGGNLLVYAEEGVDIGVDVVRHTLGQGLSLVEFESNG